MSDRPPSVVISSILILLRRRRSWLLLRRGAVIGGFAAAAAHVPRLGPREGSQALGGAFGHERGLEAKFWQLSQDGAPAPKNAEQGQSREGLYSPVGGSTEWRIKSCGSSCPYSGMSNVL